MISPCPARTPWPCPVSWWRGPRCTGAGPGSRSQRLQTSPSATRHQTPPEPWPVQCTVYMWMWSKMSTFQLIVDNVDSYRGGERSVSQWCWHQLLMLLEAPWWCEWCQGGQVSLSLSSFQKSWQQSANISRCQAGHSWLLWGSGNSWFQYFEFTWMLRKGRHVFSPSRAAAFLGAAVLQHNTDSL